MSDIDYLRGLYAAGEAKLEQQAFGSAAEAFWWCEQYYALGAFPLYDMETEKMVQQARTRRLAICKDLHSPLMSKTSFVQGCQCEKLLWLYKNRYYLREVSEEMQQKFDGGHVIGELAQHFFEGGLDVSPFSAAHYPEMQQRFPEKASSLPYKVKANVWLENTRKILLEGTQYPIYEAAFLYENVLAAMDILTFGDGKTVAYEVKASAQAKDVFITDCALQYYVISHNIPLDDICLVLLNGDYLHEIPEDLRYLNVDNCDINKLFVVQSVKNEVLEQQDFIRKKLDVFRQILANKKEPVISMGEQCNCPYTCGFIRYCTKKRGIG